MNVSFIATLTEEPEIRYVGKNKTPLVELKVAEDRGKYGINNFEVNVWGDLAVEAQLLSVGDVLDFTPYYDDKENLRYRAIVDADTWEYKGKEYSKLRITAFDWEVVE